MKLTPGLLLNSCCKQTAEINYYEINIDYISRRKHFIHNNGFVVNMLVVLKVNKMVGDNSFQYTYWSLQTVELRFFLKDHYIFISKSPFGNENKQLLSCLQNCRVMVGLYNNCCSQQRTYVMQFLFGHFKASLHRHWALCREIWNRSINQQSSWKK